MNQDVSVNPRWTRRAVVTGVGALLWWSVLGSLDGWNPDGRGLFGPARALGGSSPAGPAQDAEESDRALQPVGRAAGLGWKLTFQEEFEGERLDRSKWNTDFQGRRTNDPELQYYATDAFEVARGRLRIRASRRAGEGKAYTSGMITSADHFSQKYGYFEIRARVPRGRGLWSAFWLLPQVDDRSDPDWWKPQWPKEIDVLEHLGHEPDKVYFSNHWLDPQGEHASRTESWTGPDFSADEHTFAVQWEPGQCIWYVDGVERARMRDGVPDVPMFVLANLAVGGWAGEPAAATDFPASLEIDYIRVFQREGRSD